jgi:hypothetical protein
VLAGSHECMAPAMIGVPNVAFCSLNISRPGRTQQIVLAQLPAPDLQAETGLGPMSLLAWVDQRTSSDT